MFIGIRDHGIEAKLSRMEGEEAALHADIGLDVVFKLDRKNHHIAWISAKLNERVESIGEDQLMRCLVKATSRFLLTFQPRLQAAGL